MSDGSYINGDVLDLEVKLAALQAELTESKEQNRKLSEVSHKIYIQNLEAEHDLRARCEELEGRIQPLMDSCSEYLDFGEKMQAERDELRTRCEELEKENALFIGNMATATSQIKSHPTIKEVIEGAQREAHAAGVAEGRKIGIEQAAKEFKPEMEKLYMEGWNKGIEDAVEIVRQEPIECAEWDDAITYHERKIIAAIRAKMGGE